MLESAYVPDYLTLWLVDFENIRFIVLWVYSLKIQRQTKIKTFCGLKRNLTTMLVEN